MLHIVSTTVRECSRDNAVIQTSDKVNYPTFSGGRKVAKGTVSFTSAQEVQCVTLMSKKQSATNNANCSIILVRPLQLVRVVSLVHAHGTSGTRTWYVWYTHMVRLVHAHGTPGTRTWYAWYTACISVTEGRR